MYKTLSIVFCVLVLGCAVSLEPNPPSPEAIGASYYIPLEPDDVYLQWFKELVACEGVYRPYNNIVWYVVPKNDWIKLGRGEFWRFPHFAFLRADHLFNKTTVKHEMKHYLTQDGNHPTGFYNCLWDHLNPGF